jgi:hypothetical protein
MRVVLGVGAGDEGVHAFQPMDDAEPAKLVERAIDLQRRAKAVVAQEIEDLIGAERGARAGQGREDEPLVFCQFRRQALGRFMEYWA